MDYSVRVTENFHKFGLDALVVIGGDGTLAIAHRFSKAGIPIVGVPKTIDNDIVGTVSCFGFDTAVRLRDRRHRSLAYHGRSASSHHGCGSDGPLRRVDCAVRGVAGGADVILIPEIPFDFEIVAARLREREKFGARFSIVVVAEGAVPIGGKVSTISAGDAATAERLGGLSASLCPATRKINGKRNPVRRARPFTARRQPHEPRSYLATRFGGKAVECLLKGEFDVMVASQPPDIVTVPLEQVVGKQKRVPADFDLIRTARATGITFGDGTSLLLSGCAVR